MTQPYCFEPAALPSLAVEGTGQRFAVRAIHCVARNYADHAREMGADPSREPPFFFRKGIESLVTNDAGPVQVTYPVITNDLHHEVEMVVAIGPGLEIFGYGVGIDFTRRDRQAEAKEKGRPWEIAKTFPGAAPVGPLVPAAKIGHPRSGKVTLAVDGEVRQSGDLAQMIWSVEEVIGHLQSVQALAPGDLIFTGTPAGVGAVTKGQTLECKVEGVGSLTVRML